MIEFDLVQVDLMNVMFKRSTCAYRNSSTVL